MDSIRVHLMAVDRALRDEVGDWRNSESLRDGLIDLIVRQIYRGSNVIVLCSVHRYASDLMGRLTRSFAEVPAKISKRRLEYGGGTVTITSTLRGYAMNRCTMLVGHLTWSTEILNTVVLPAALTMPSGEGTLIVTSDRADDPARNAIATLERKEVTYFTHL